MAKTDKMKIKKWKQHQLVAVENAAHALEALDAAGVGVAIVTEPNGVDQTCAFSYKNLALLTALTGSTDEVSERERDSMLIPLRESDETEAELLAKIPAKQLARARAHRLINDHQIAGDGSPLVEAKSPTMDEEENYWPSDIAYDIDDEGPFDFIERAAEQLESVSEGFLKAELKAPMLIIANSNNCRRFVIKSQFNDEVFDLFSIQYPTENFPATLRYLDFDLDKANSPEMLRDYVKQYFGKEATRNIVRAMIQRAKA